MLEFSQLYDYTDIIHDKEPFGGKMSRVLGCVIIIILIFTGCDPFGSDKNPESRFEATISGDFTGHVQGQASFGTFVDPVTGMIATIIILTSSDGSQRGINISGLTNIQIEERSYPITATVRGSDNPFQSIVRNEFAASYLHNNAQYSKTFISQIGEISFSSSSENVLQGTFSFDAQGYRYMTNENEISDSTESMITIIGNFTSVRGQ